MNSCNECGRFHCDCEVMTLDIYGTEIVPGEDYIVNQYGEIISMNNTIRYLLDDSTHQLKTR